MKKAVRIGIQIFVITANGEKIDGRAHIQCVAVMNGVVIPAAIKDAIFTLTASGVVTVGAVGGVKHSQLHKSRMLHGKSVAVNTGIKTAASI